jgi:peptidoglycan/LPS O-acetylase OafA/YrhL
VDDHIPAVVNGPLSDRPTERYLPTGDEAGTAPEDRAFRPDIEGLRAVAVVLVVLLHVGVAHVQGGTVGVDVFFVISGFVITGVLLRDNASTGGIGFVQFYARRARRILPMALGVIVVTVIVIDLLAAHSYAVSAASDGRWSALFLGDFRFMRVDPNILVSRQSPFGQYWSLAVEEQFYLLYPAFFVGVAAWKRNWSLRHRLTFGLICVIVASFTASVLTSHVGLLGAYYSPLTRAWELAVGCLLAVTTPYFQRLPPTIAAIGSWVGLAGILASADLISFRVAYPGYAAALPVGGAALVIAGGTVAPRWGAEALLGTFAFRWIGRFSYSWYLWHLAILVMAAEYARTTYEASSVGLRLVLALVALVVAAASYFFVESPIRHSKRIAQNPLATLVAAGFLVGVCVLVTYAV